MSVGYSGTPLPKKLGISATTQIAVLGKPAEYEALLGELPRTIKISTSVTGSTNLVHVFTTKRIDLATQLSTLRMKLDDGIPVWVSWPKKSSKVATDITEGVIREVALPLGFVDIKVCAVSEVWSGLKLVVRKGLRSGAA